MKVPLSVGVKADTKVVQTADRWVEMRVLQKAVSKADRGADCWADCWDPPSVEQMADTKALKLAEKRADSWVSS